MSAPSAGAETMHRLAPGSRCFAAASRLVKMPGAFERDIDAELLPRQLRRVALGSTAILPRPISIQSSPVVISPGKRPCTLSYFKRWAFASTEPRSLIADDLRSSRACLVQRAQHQPADAAEPIDRNPYRHPSSALLSRNGCSPSIQPQPLAAMCSPRIIARQSATLGGDAEMLEERLAGRRGAKAHHADHAPCGRDIALPAERRAASTASRGAVAQHLGAIGLVARHRTIPSTASTRPRRGRRARPAASRAAIAIATSEPVASSVTWRSPSASAST